MDKPLKSTEARVTWRTQASVMDGLRARVNRSWANPLLNHARRQHPLPLNMLRWLVPLAALGAAVVVIIAWLFTMRVPGALLMGISAAVVMFPVVLAPLMSAHRVARQMAIPEHDPRSLTELAPQEIITGLVLVTLWQLRWLLVFALIFTPALVISLLHIGISDAEVLRDSIQVLGAASSATRMQVLSVGGGIPYFRLIVQSLSTVLLAWTSLPLLASLGVTAALLLGDLWLTDLAALLAEIVSGVTLMLLWGFLARTSLLAGSEPIRLILLILFFVLLAAATALLNRTNTVLLINSVPLADTYFD